MSFTYKYNALSGNFDIVQDSTLLTLKGVVATTADLPLTGNTENDLYVVKAGDRLYTWNKAASSGLITDWVDVGTVSAIDWSVITNKPTSSVANIDLAVAHKDVVIGNPHSVTKTEVGLGNVDNKSEATIITDVKADADVSDAITKKHAQGTDQGLDTGGANAVTAAQAKAGYTHSGVVTGNPHSVNKTDISLGNVDNVQQMPLSYLDIDTALAANSDSKVASQKAVKTYIDLLLAANDAMVYKGAVNCSGNPNYPAADAGHTYRVSVAGKIGGASGINVEIGDFLVCNTDNTASGDQATVGAYWNIIQSNLDGAVIGCASAVDSNLVAFDGATGKLIKDSLLTTANVSDAISLKHTQNTDSTLIVGDTSIIITDAGVGYITVKVNNVQKEYFNDKGIVLANNSGNLESFIGGHADGYTAWATNAYYTTSGWIKPATGASAMMVQLSVTDSEIQFYSSIAGASPISNWLKIGNIKAAGWTIGAGTANIDYTLTFDGETNDGIITWMEDEDYFSFGDGIMIASTEQIYFRDTAILIGSSNDGHLDLTADVSVDINGLLDLATGQIKFPATQNPSADINTLDDYEEYTWTPDLVFGGAKVGITYSSTTGTYTKIGNVVFITLDFTLTSKGTSVGNASINGLPFTVGSITFAAPTAYFSNMATSVNHCHRFEGTTTSISLAKQDGTIVNRLVDTDFTDTSRLVITGFYTV